MELHKEWIEIHLKNRSNEQTIQRIISTDYKTVVGEGDNYTSDMKRVQMKVVLGSGEITNKSVIIKRVPEKQVEGTFAREYPLFQNEIEVYTNIFPSMEKMMKERGDFRETVWCQCFGHLGNDLLLMEDLKESGYKLADRFEGQDLSHSILTLRSLGRYHAMSSVLYDRNKSSFEKFGEYLMAVNDKTVSKMRIAGFDTLVDVIRTTWGKDWKSVADKLEKKRDLIPDELKNLLSKDDNAFNVLNHGDCWTNNMLFKYDLDTNKPIAVKFVDLQVCHYNYYCWDIVYFMYSSVRRDVRKNHLNDLLEAYRNSVKVTLELMGSDIGRVPTLDQMKHDLHRFEPYAILVDVVVTPIIMAPPEDKWDFKGVISDDEVQPDNNKNMYFNEKYKEALQYDLKHFSSLDHI